VATPVIMPKLEMAQETATVIEWLREEGEQVEKGQPLLTVETDKVTVEIESPASGILAGIRAGPQQVVPVTEIIAYILEPGEELSESVDRQIGKSANQQINESADRQVLATPVAQRLATAEGVDLRAVEGTGPRGRITKADVLAVASAPPPPPSTPGPASRPRPATPAARRIARERGVDLATVPGSGPRGRVQAADVLAVAPTRLTSRLPKSARLRKSSEGEGEARVVPLQGMRRTIAERMTVSYRTAPHIALTMRVDMDAFEGARARLNARAEAEGLPRASVTALIVKAVAWALKRHPWLNSTLRDDEIHLLPEINIGVAVALDDGLIVPVVRGADRKGVAEIAAEVRDLTIRAREGRLTPTDVSGGTFTISNLGPFGVEQFTAIINPPQVAILALGAIQPEATGDERGELVIRPIMRMTLSADHRVVDGAVAARFLADLREALETPTLLLW